MQTPTDVPARVQSLNEELSSAVDHYRLCAQWNYRFALTLMTITLAASAVAGVGGIFLGLSGEITGGVALLPGVLALTSTVLKPQGRANWHYRKKDELNALRRRLLYELPVPPSPDNVAAISNDWAKLDKAMNDEWEKNFALNWAAFAGGHSATQPSAGP